METSQRRHRKCLEALVEVVGWWQLLPRKSVYFVSDGASMRSQQILDTPQNVCGICRSVVVWYRREERVGHFGPIQNARVKGPLIEKLSLHFECQVCLLYGDLQMRFVNRRTTDRHWTFCDRC